jgi:predicted alpha/beta-fold hydrolase
MPLTSPRLYHGGETDDTRSVILYLSHKYPNAPLYAVGFSLGANTLSVYLGEEGEMTPLKAAVLLANPWEYVYSSLGWCYPVSYRCIDTHSLVAGATWIETGSLINRFIYGPFIASALRVIFTAGLLGFPPNTTSIDLPMVLAKKYFTIRWFDDHVTTKLFGFKDANDYYTKASSTPHVTSIRIPTLGLHAMDDPIIAAHNLPWDQVVKTENVIIASTERGGHVGWFTSEQGNELAASMFS